MTTALLVDCLGVRRIDAECSAVDSKNSAAF